MRTLIAAAALAAFAAPVLADEVKGTVAGFNASTNVLTLTDKTIWYLPAGTVLPEGMMPGDGVRLLFQSNADNGWQSFDLIERY